MAWRHPTWDRVAVKFSYDQGVNWTQPTPIVVNGMPSNFQRPFDPTLAVINNDSLRIYFSSSAGTPPGLDSSVNTYSAITTDGINYSFEQGARVDVLLNRVIDPAVILFNNAWHYISPIGAPQQGAYHFIGPDGVNFSSTPDIPSDNLHNWTGNYMIESPAELRFYGSGSSVWYNSTSNGGVWNGYISTNVHGGDPSVVKTSNTNYLMIYVGPPAMSVNPLTDSQFKNEARLIYMDGSNHQYIAITKNLVGSEYSIIDGLGKRWATGRLTRELTTLNIEELPNGSYFITIYGKEIQSITLRTVR
jgi:hypothetical protein